MLAFVAFGATLTARHWQSTVTSPGIERAYFRAAIADNEQDYLYRLRDTHLGCKTIAYRDPGIVFLGDSHSYAGWDYAVLQAQLRPLTVGNCALAGMFPENIEDFVNLVTGGGLSARFIVFGIQPRMFWDVPERGDRVRQARRLMSETRNPRESLPGLVTGQWRQIDRFAGAAASEEAKIRRLSSALQGIDPAAIDEVLASGGRAFHALDFWLGYVAEGGPMPGVPELVARTCRAVRRAGVRLGVVYIPESRWLNEQYTLDQRRSFEANAALFRECADWVDVSAFESGGYDNKYFTNRYLVDNYPYHGWLDPDVALRWIAEDPAQRRWQFFDPDHMSALGARTFSVTFAPALADWIHSPNTGGR